MDYLSFTSAGTEVRDCLTVVVHPGERTWVGECKFPNLHPNCIQHVSSKSSLSRNAIHCPGADQTRMLRALARPTLYSRGRDLSRKLLMSASEVNVPHPDHRRPLALQMANGLVHHASNSLKSCIGLSIVLMMVTRGSYIREAGSTELRGRRPFCTAAIIGTNLLFVIHTPLLCGAINKQESTSRISPLRRGDSSNS